MSLLNEISESRKTAVSKKADRIRYITKTTVDEIVRSWKQSFDLIWEDSNPQEVLDALGEDGEEVFELNQEAFLYICNILADRKQSELDTILLKVASKPKTSVDESGKITIN